MTFVDDIESAVDEVSAWGANIVKTVVTTLAPDGRGFGQQKMSIEEQLNQYRQIRNDPDAWTTWVATKATEIENILTNSGVAPDTIGAINPTQLAIAYMFEYSSKMEKELNKRML